MGVYSGHILVENTREKELTLEEVLELQESALFIMSDLCLESDEEDDTEFEELMEGANTDYRKAFNVGSKAYKESLKASKRALRNRDYKKARSHIKDAQKSLDEIQKTLNKVDSSVGSTILSWFPATLLTMVEFIVPIGYIVGGSAIKGLGSAILSKAGGNASKVMSGSALYGFGFGTKIGGQIIVIIQAITLTIRDVKQIIEDIEDDDISTTQAWNMYRNKLCSYIKNMDNQLDKMCEVINNKERLDK